MEEAPSATAALSLADTKKLVVDALPADPVRVSIENLRVEQAKCKARKKEISKLMKNEKRKQARLRKRARQMTDEDLVSVLMMRKQRALNKNEADSSVPSSTSASSCSASGSVATSSTTPAASEDGAVERSPRLPPRTEGASPSPPRNPWIYLFTAWRRRHSSEPSAQRAPSERGRARSWVAIRRCHGVTASLLKQGLPFFGRQHVQTHDGPCAEGPVHSQSQSV